MMSFRSGLWRLERGRGLGAGGFPTMEWGVGGGLSGRQGEEDVEVGRKNVQIGRVCNVTQRE
jgi:hypothetical protein